MVYLFCIIKVFVLFPLVFASTTPSFNRFCTAASISSVVIQFRIVALELFFFIVCSLNVMATVLSQCDNVYYTVSMEPHRVITQGYVSDFRTTHTSLSSSQLHRVEVFCNSHRQLGKLITLFEMSVQCTGTPPEAVWKLPLRILQSKNSIFLVTTLMHTSVSLTWKQYADQEL